eukprot:9523046-Alexandrium_andersonii.AAC.1
MGSERSDIDRGKTRNGKRLSQPSQCKGSRQSPKLLTLSPPNLDLGEWLRPLGSPTDHWRQGSRGG